MRGPQGMPAGAAEQPVRILRVRRTQGRPDERLHARPVQRSEGMHVHGRPGRQGRREVNVPEPVGLRVLPGRDHQHRRPVKADGAPAGLQHAEVVRRGAFRLIHDQHPPALGLRGPAERAGQRVQHLRFWNVPRGARQGGPVQVRPGRPPHGHKGRLTTGTERLMQRACQGWQHPGQGHGDLPVLRFPHGAQQVALAEAGRRAHVPELRKSPWPVLPGALQGHLQRFELHLAVIHAPEYRRIDRYAGWKAPLVTCGQDRLELRRGGRHGRGPLKAPRPSTLVSPQVSHPRRRMPL